jgi:hypothetical protein
MNPTKVYQNVSYAELMAFASSNPHCHRALAPIHTDTSTVDTAMEGMPHYSMCALTPASPLSVIACIDDPTMYSLTALNLRIQQLSELTTTLQVRTEDLKGGTLYRKRKAIHDLIGAAFNGARMEPKDCLLLYQGLAQLVEVHFILLQDAIAATAAGNETEANEMVPNTAPEKGTIFFSSDPATWSHPIWVADLRGHWVAVPSDGTEKTDIVTWLTRMEEQRWVIEWPIVEGTKVDIVDRLKALPGWKETDAKHLKDVLAQRLGRRLALRQLEKM